MNLLIKQGKKVVVINPNYIPHDVPVTVMKGTDFKMCWVSEPEQK